MSGEFKLTNGGGNYNHPRYGRLSVVTTCEWRHDFSAASTANSVKLQYSKDIDFAQKDGKDPGRYYSLVLVFAWTCVGWVGDCRASVVESSLKYHSVQAVLNLGPCPGWGQCLVGSLTGAVAS